MCRCQRAQPTATETEATAVPAEHYHLKARLFHQGTETPVNSARWDLVDSDGLVACSGTTTEDGMILEELPSGGSYTLRVVEFPSLAAQDDAAATG